MRSDERFQFLDIFLCFHIPDLHIRDVYLGPELVMAVQNIDRAAGHAGAHVQSYVAEHHDGASGHIFAEVMARALNHCSGPAVPYREPLSGHSCGIELAADRPIEHGIPYNDMFVRLVRDVRRYDRDPSAVHALTGVIVRISYECER